VEEGAGFADRFEGAVQLCRPGAVAVAEQAAVFAAEPGILGPIASAGSCGGCP
jgi:hypothetical protein